jgi:hypothetical protein
LELILPWLLVAGLLYILRRLQTWLHQHLFKVGWLVTKQYETTTLLYYAFFMPGIVLHELVYWMVAGFLDVRADRAIRWPEKQEIGQLKLNFIKLSPKTDPMRLAVISTAPFVVGVLILWFIANNIFNVQRFAVTMQSGYLNSVADALRQLTATQDFWLWFYLAFAISNTMMPHTPQHLRLWRVIGGVAAVVAVGILIVGVGSQAVINLLTGPVADTLNRLSLIFAFIIGLDVFMVAVLGTIEAIVERITGDSATFQDGKMITMRRSEVLALRAKQLMPQPKATTKAAPAGAPSIYSLPLPIPGPPGREVVTRGEGLIIEPEKPAALPPSATSGRVGPAVIPGMAAERPPSAAPTANPPGLATNPKPAAPSAPGVKIEPPTTGPRPAPVKVEPPGGGARPPTQPPRPAQTAPSEEKDVYEDADEST